MRVNGAELHYEDTRAGERAIVLSHGLFWSGEMYAAQIEVLRHRYRCITFDFRGQGRSEITRAGYDMETLSEDAAALIDALGCAPCHFVGLSMGGFIGMRLAARRRELVRSLVLVASAADPEPRWNAFKYRWLGRIARRTGIAPFNRIAMKAMFGRTFLRAPERAEERERMRQILLSLDPEAAIRALGGVTDRLGVEGELGRIRAPTLVLSGDEDTSVTTERSRRTAERIPGARLVVVRGAGHTSTIEEPDAVTREIERFVTAVDDGRA